MATNKTSNMQSITPDAFEVTRDKQTGDQVRLSFFRGEQGFHAVMPQNQIALFVSHVLKEGQVSLNGPMDSEDLEIANVMAPLGRELRKLPDGSAVLTIHIQTNDGARSLPLHFSAADVGQLLSDLGSR